MKRTSIQDIAKKIGVSKGTVSLVLSGKVKGGRVSEQMCKKVRETAEAMNYQPNEIARSLSTGMTMSIGVVVTDISNEFYGHLAFHIQEQAKKHGYTVIIANTNEDLEEFKNSITILLNKQIDGIIIVPVDNGQKVVEKIIDRRVPMVQIDRYYPDINANYIIVDNYSASCEITELLISEGCRRVAFICYDINLNSLLERRQGYIDVLKRHSLFDPELVKDIDYNNQEKDIKQSIIDLKNNPDKVDAIFFCSRKAFVSGIRYMHQEKIKISDEMQVICFDKIETFANIPINYVEQPIKEMGKKAVDILMEQIDGSTQIQQLIFKAKVGFVDNST
jgi:LacI family transcriptional regulator